MYLFLMLIHMFMFLRVVPLGTRSHGFDYRRFRSTIKPIFLLPISQDDLWVPIRHIWTQAHSTKMYQHNGYVFMKMTFIMRTKIKFIS